MDLFKMLNSEVTIISMIAGAIIGGIEVYTKRKEVEYWDSFNNRKGNKNKSKKQVRKELKNECNEPNEFDE